MSINFNVSHISYRFFCDKLSSIDLSKNLIIESSANNIEFKSNNKNINFNSNNILNYGLNMDDKDLSNIQTIRGNILNIDTLFLSDISNSRDNIIDDNFIEDGYIRRTTIGYNPAEPTLISASDGYFRYINVSGGDSSFNNSVYIKNRLDVSGTTTISNDLIVNGASYVTLYNSINNYIASIGRDLSTIKIVTKDLSASNVSISNDLVVSKTSFINDLSISGHLVDNILKVPHDFTIDPSPYNDISGTLIINGDLIVYGNRTIVASSIVEISDITLNVATNLTISNDLYWNNAGLSISNVASIKYDGINWNFEGGQLSVENKKVSFDASLIALKNSVEASLNILNSSFDLSYSQLKQNNDTSFNVIYTKSQIDNSFLLISNLDLSLTNYKSYIDNSYVKTTTFDASFSDLQTYLDASYILKGTISNPNAIDLSLNFLSNKLDLSYVSKSVFDASYNNLKSQIEISFASVRLTSLNTPSISVDTINTKHSSGQTFNTTLWNQLGLDISNGGPFNNNYNKIAVSNDGKVVAYSKLYSVLDPSQVEQAVTNWTLRTIPTNFLNGYNRAIAWSPQLQIFVVVGYGTSNTKTMYSYNGIDWYLGSMLTSLGGTYSNTVCWSPELKLFVGIGGYERDNRSDYKAMTSSDGINWTERITPTISRNSQWVSICWSPELSLFVAVAVVGQYKLITSPNGITWTIRPLDNIYDQREFTANLRSVCWSAQLGIFVALDGFAVIISKNGINWNRYIYENTEFGHNRMQDICWSPQLGLFVAVGSLGSYRIITSTNGIDWTPVYNMIDQGGTLFFVDWIKELNLFVALRTFTNDVYSLITSPDGKNWTRRTDPSPVAGGWLGCAWSSEQRILVAVGSRGVTGHNGSTSKIMTSSVTTPFALEPKGRVYVYELSYNQTSYNWNQLGLSSEIIVGLSDEDQFGWDIALSSNGRVVAGSSIVSYASGINCGQVRLFELSNNIWRQKGLNINGPRANSESGYSISLAGNGNSIAIGAWKDSSNGTNICGAVRVYDFSSSINDWRQKGPTIFGISGSNEGYSTALSLDGLTLASGNPSYNTSTTITNTATGGTITTSGSYRIHSFTTVGSDTFTPSFSGSVEVLIVAGGGGGGQSLGGGGGGGGVIYIPSVNVTSGTNYSIVVGDGGASSTNGQNSSAFTSIAAGGGCGGEYRDINGKDGGCGGGAGTTERNLVYGGRGHTELVQAGITTGINIRGSNSNAIMHGFRGGNLTVARGGNWKAPGGGGAGAQGLDTDPLSPNDAGQYGASSGGQGISYNILGTSYYWAGGGGGGNWNAARAGWGALGGGGGGSGVVGGPGGGSALNSGFSGNNSQAAGGAGGANTGGGGGGGAYGNPGGKGGSGIVVIRYLEQVTISTSIVNLNVGLVKIFSWSGTTWAPKGTIQGRDISNSYFGRAIKLSANGNTIVIGAPGYTNNEYRIPPVYEYNSTAMNWQSHRDNAITVYGRDLAVILNASQNARANALRNNTLAYIGGRRRIDSSTPSGKTSADWEWVTGDVWNYQNFSSGEPNSLDEKAAHFWYSDGKWNDINSASNYPAIYMYYKARVLSIGLAYAYGYVGGTTWTQLGQTLVGISGGNEFGSSVAISNDGTIISVGTNDISSNRGYVNVYKYVDNYWRQISNTLNGKVLSFKAGLNALSGDGTTLFQSNNNYYTVYGINKILTLNSPITSISGNLIVIGATSINSLDISRNQSFSTNGYSYKVFESALTTAIMKEYYSNVMSTRDLKVQILGNGDIRNINNSYRSLSDSRLKENIVTSGPKLEDLLKVRVVNYNLKGSNSTKYIGVLAQELEDVFPNLVTEIEPSPKDIQEGRLIKYKAVNYSSFDALLIKSLQEQNAMLKNIEKRIIALEDELDDN